MKLKQKKSNEGFSILEVIIALFIVAVMLALYQATLYGIPLAKNAKDQDLALKIAANKMESLRENGYGSLPATSFFTDSLLASLPSSSATVLVSDYNAKTKQVTVTVFWREHNSATLHSVSLGTLITQIGGLQ